MKRFLKLFLMIFSISFLSLHTKTTFDSYQVEIEKVVGAQPHNIFYDKATNIIHIICVGSDANYNGQQDSGDVVPSWWIIDQNTKSRYPREVATFPFMSLEIAANRPAIDIDNQIMYLAMSDGIKKFNLKDYKQDEEFLIDVKAKALAYGHNMLFASINPTYGKVGKVQIYNGMELEQEVEGQLNVQDIITFTDNQETNGFAFINIGDYAGGKSTVSICRFNTGKWEVNSTIEVGKTANYLYFDKGMLYTLCNGSNNIVQIDATTEKITNNYFPATSGWNGPRQMIINDDKIFVSCYSGDVRIIDLKTGVDDICLLGAKGEGLCLLPEGQIAVAIQLTDYYGTNNKIALINKLDAYFDDMNFVSLETGINPVIAIPYQKYNNSYFVISKGIDRNGNNIQDTDDATANIYSIYPTEDDYKAKKIVAMAFNELSDKLNPILLPSGKLLLPYKSSMSIAQLDEFRYNQQTEELELKEKKFENIIDPDAIDVRTIMNAEQIIGYSENIFFIIINNNIDFTILYPNKVTGIALAQDSEKLFYLADKDSNNTLNLMYSSAIDNIGIEVKLDSLLPYNSKIYLFDQHLLISYTDDKNNYVKVYDADTLNMQGIINIGETKNEKSLNLYEFENNIVVLSNSGSIKYLNLQDFSVKQTIPINNGGINFTVLKNSVGEEISWAIPRPYDAEGQITNIVDIMYLDDAISVKDNNINILNIYPNPISANQTLNIDLSESKGITNCKISIYDMQGQYITSVNNTNSVNISDEFVKGTYFIILESTNRIIGRQKFIVK